MSPEEYLYSPPQQQPQPSRKRAMLAIVFGALSVTALLIFIIFRSTSSGVSDPGYKLHATDLESTRNFNTIQADDMYGYNGMAFYKVNLKDGSNLIVLRSGLKLPQPSNIIWAGPTGAFMTFSGSFSGSQLTKTIGYLVDESERQYVWYLDFATGSLKLVSKTPMVGNTAYYSSTDKGFYYVTRPSATASNSAVPLLFYSIGSDQNIQIVEDLAIDTLQEFTECANNEKVCFIGQEKSTGGNDEHQDDKLFSISSSNKKSMLLESEGRLFDTNNPDLYISISQTTNNSANIAAQARLHNLSDKSVKDLGFEGSLQLSLSATVTPDSNFFTFSNEYVTEKNGKQDGSSYRAGVIPQEGAGKSELFKLTRIDEQPFISGITNAISNRDGTYTIVTSTEDKQFLFSKEQSVPEFTAQDRQTVEAAVKSCLASGALNYQYFDTGRQFRIELTYDENFNRNIGQVSNCLIQKGGSVIIGYNYSFVGVDPTNGRLSTD